MKEMKHKLGSEFSELAEDDCPDNCPDNCPDDWPDHGSGEAGLASPMDRVLDALQYTGERSGDRCMCLCPAHDDSRHSLSVRVGGEGKVLLHCFAGCSTERVLAAVGLKMRDLFPVRSAVEGRRVGASRAPAQGDAQGDAQGIARRDAQGGVGRIVATYDYCDAEGTLLYQVVRKEPKSFYQRQPEAKGRWINHLQGVPRVLYRLGELIEAPAAAPVFIVEGEKDADNLRRLGLVATTNAQGAGKWEAHFNSWLAGRRVCILPDNDDAGCKHAHAIALQLVGVAAEVKLLELPGVPPKGDVSDWLQAGGTVADLLARVEGARLYGNDRTGNLTGNGKLRGWLAGVPHHTDIGNTQRMYTRVRDRVMYVPHFGKWYLWTGSHWREDNHFAVMALAKETVLKMYAEVAAYEDDEQRKEFLKWVVRSESRQRLEAMLSLLRSEPGISVSPDMLDQETMLLPCLNGTVDLRSGRLQPGDPAHRFTKCLDIAYDPAAECPLWQAFLLRVMGGNSDLVSFIQRLVGHALTGDATGKYLVFLWGPKGNNGKSTLTEMLMRLLGPFAMKSPTEMVMAKSYRGGVPNDIARLRSVRFTVTNEVDEGMMLSEGIVKDLTGRDTLTARFMREEFFDFLPTHKLWIYGNHRPEIRGTDAAIWDRVKLLPFEVEIPEAERDPHLFDKLLLELEGILAWAVRGCLAWREVGIHAPPVIKAATDAYRDEQDMIGQFIEDCCELGAAFSVGSGVVYQGYVAWCAEMGIRPESGTKFGAELGQRGYAKVRTMNLRLRQGLHLKSYWLRQVDG
jgi:putative DNA primase/helicase